LPSDEWEGCPGSHLHFHIGFQGVAQEVRGKFFVPRGYSGSWVPISALRGEFRGGIAEAFWFRGGPQQGASGWDFWFYTEANNTFELPEHHLTLRCANDAATGLPTAPLEVKTQAASSAPSMFMAFGGGPRSASSWQPAVALDVTVTLSPPRGQTVAARASQTPDFQPLPSYTCGECGNATLVDFSHCLHCNAPVPRAALMAALKQDADRVVQASLLQSLGAGEKSVARALVKARAAALAADVVLVPEEDLAPEVKRSCSERILLGVHCVFPRSYLFFFIFFHSVCVHTLNINASHLIIVSLSFSLYFPSLSFLSLFLLLSFLILSVFAPLPFAVFSVSPARACRCASSTAPSAACSARRSGTASPSARRSPKPFAASSSPPPKPRNSSPAPARAAAAAGRPSARTATTPWQPRRGTSLAATPTTGATNARPT
jgi:hypothetical protein